MAVRDGRVEGLGRRKGEHQFYFYFKLPVRQGDSRVLDLGFLIGEIKKSHKMLSKNNFLKIFFFF